MKGNLYTLTICLLAFLPILAVAAGEDATTPFRSLVGIPGVTDGGAIPNSFAGYINALYFLAIGVAGLLVVIKLIYAGTKYMLSDIVTDKQSAKQDIKWALVGLLIVLGAVIILTTINTDLTEVDVALEPLNVDTSNAIQQQIDSIRSFEESCDQAGDYCTILDCPRGQDCNYWCSQQGSITEYRSNGLLAYYLGAADQRRGQCIVQIDPTTIPDQGDFQQECAPYLTARGNGVMYDCRKAERICEDNNAEPSVRNSVQKEITCVRN